MRILKVAQAYYPFQEKGGPVVKVRAIARGLAQRGYQVTVLTADLGLSKRSNSTAKYERCAWGWRSVQDGGIEVVYLSSFMHYRALTINPHVIGFCRTALRQFDLVHFYGLYDLLGPSVSHFCRRLGIPYVVEPMGMYRPIVRNIGLKRMYHVFLGRQFVGRARFLIATSEQEKQELIEDGIEASHIVIRRNGIDFPQELPARGEFRRQWSIADNSKLILFLGRLVSKKSPDMLIEAFARWRSKSTSGNDAVLVLAGPVEDDAFVSRLKANADRLGLGKRVRFVGPIYDHEKWQAYRDADVFVLPSQNENFGNTAAESAVCGTPVIVTDRCGIAPLVGQAGIVIPYDCDELEQALGRLLEDPVMLQHCQEGCREMARSLSWDDPLDVSEKLYRQCLSEDARR
jgi:glycosyltransferase involved in cell wall biosynthesis